mmetsp:Transcript_31957/g.82732  ORF Transcript_31957/g.82732 Transcript_31957/m.82732 type:complete len:360 (-) Transcript_31957:26-1105(-)
MLLHDLGRAEGRPTMLVRVGLEVSEGAVHGRAEERHTTDGVVERRDTRFQLGIQADVRRLVQELRLGIDLGAAVAAHGLRQGLVLVDRHRDVGRGTARKAEAKSILHGALAGAELGRRPRGHAKGSRGARDLNRDGPDFQVSLAGHSLRPELDALDALQGTGRGAHALVLRARGGRLAGGGAPLVAEVRERDADLHEVLASWHRELRFEAAAAQGDGSSSCTCVGRGHGACREGCAEAGVVRRRRAHLEHEISAKRCRGIRELAVCCRLDEAGRPQAGHVDNLAVEDSEVARGVHLPRARRFAAHHGVVQFHKLEGRAGLAIKGRQIDARRRRACRTDCERHCSTHPEDDKRIDTEWRG